MQKAEDLVIIIGSARQSHTLDNPFTTGERIVMLRASLDDMKISPTNYYLIPVPDAEMHSAWVPEVVSFSPPFEIVYSNEPLTFRLFKEAGFKVEKIPMFQRELYSATEVRRRIIMGENWKEPLLPSVVKIIEKIGGVERIRELATTDSPLKRKAIS